MPIARGLPGTKDDKEVVYCRNIAMLPSIVKSGKYASTADSNGAIGVWLDDKKRLRGEACRHLRTIDSQIFKILKAARQWYAEWMRKIA